MTTSPPSALTIAGSDSGGAAGLQADLRTFLTCGVHGLVAVTAVTVQNTLGVHDRADLPPHIVAGQIEAVAADMGVGIVPLSTAREDVERGRLVRWWIEGARINWGLGVARLSGGYLSPVCQSFIELCHEYFGAGAKADEGRPRRARKKTPSGKKRRGAKAAGRSGTKKSASRA